MEEIGIFVKLSKNEKFRFEGPFDIGIG